MKNIWERDTDGEKGGPANARRNFWYSVGGAAMGAVGTIVVQIVMDMTLNFVIRGGLQFVPTTLLAMFGVALIVAIDDRTPSAATFVAAPLGAAILYLAVLVIW